MRSSPRVGLQSNRTDPAFSPAVALKSNAVARPVPAGESRTLLSDSGSRNLCAVGSPRRRVRHGQLRAFEFSTRPRESI